MSRRSFQHHDRQFRTLAEVLLVGEWSVAGLSKSIRSALGTAKRQRRRRAQLRDDIWTAFGSRPIPPLLRDLTEFLRQLPAARKLVLNPGRNRSLFERVDRLQFPPPQMRTHPSLPITGNLPVLTTPGDLAAWLKVTPCELDWFAGIQRREPAQGNAKRAHYRYSWVKRRLIEAPKPRLKAMQRRLLDEMLEHIPVHPAAGAFRRGVSLLASLEPHAAQRIVLRLDLCDFFPSIPASRIVGLFRTAGYPERVARLLAGLCTNRVPEPILSEGVDRFKEPARWDRFRVPHLPQGAPTSPALANLCAFRLDRRLAGLARRFDANYTRYADDLLFSGGNSLARDARRFRVWALAILLDEGFEIQHRKTRSMTSGRRQTVCGLTLNERPNVARAEFDRLKAILFNCRRFSPDSQNRDGHPRFREHLRGRIDWVAQVHPKRGEKLRGLFDAIVW